MKFLTLAVLFAFIIPAHASYVSLSCSNATGTVIWEEGQNANMARLTYDGFVTGVLNVEREKLTIDFKEEVYLREVLLAQCGAQSTMATFAAKVVITPTERHPDVFQSYFPDNRIEADVICEKIVSNQTDCRP